MALRLPLTILRVQIEMDNIISMVPTVERPFGINSFREVP